jgi:hypothetical protein
VQCLYYGVISNERSATNIGKGNYQMITVSVSGFSNKEQAQVFVDWYYGQGEQDAEFWFDEWCPEINPCELKCEVKEIK